MTKLHSVKATMIAIGMVLLAPIAGGEESPAKLPPRSISGDPREPQWEQRLTITVGPAKADLVGSDDKVIQAAIDYVVRLGGGTVHILPGTYRLRNSIFLRSGLRLKGSGPESVLLKEPSTVTKLSASSDWYDREITLADPTGFQVGDGVCLRAQNPHSKATTVLRRTLVARTGNRFKLDRALRENFWLQGEATAATLFPILCGENIAGVTIENITLDGNKAHNDFLDGNYSGCVFLQDCRRITLRGATARNNNGDGISWQICHDVTVEGCHSHDNASLGLHPGSGSQRPIIRGNKIQRNDIGIFFCWGVRGGLAEKNVIEDSRSYGVSIGHRDTDNLVCDNDIVRSGRVGVLFRVDGRPEFAPHRNRIERNRITDSGAKDGVGIDIQGTPAGIVLADNTIRDSRPSAARIGIRIGAGTGPVELSANEIDGYATRILDLRKR
jgi:Right handed beta helix region